MAADAPMNAQEVAELLRVGKNKVYELAKSGELASYRVGRKLRFSPSDVDAYLARRRFGGSQESTAAGDAELQAAAPEDTLCVAGDELAADVLANTLARRGVPTSRSYVDGYRSLVDLYAGTVDAAICALFDQRTNSYNVPFVQRLAPGTSVIVARLFVRKRGFVVRAGNPKRIASWGALLREGVRIANTRKGSSSRVLLDEKLLALEATHEMVAGYGDEAGDEMAVLRVLSGDADVCVGTPADVEGQRGLEFVPLQTEHVDLVVRKSSRTHGLMPLVRRLSENVRFRSRLEGLESCNAELLGTIVYEC